ncbi:MAG TPA: hypothetical protein DEA55_10030 [Rhodospirillaceae bacterium]|nr:hypothetical protein [Rhodospirillaceae bacterium]
MTQAKTKPASQQEIRSILHDADDDLVLAILETGATYQEIKQAAGWLDDSGYMGNKRGKPMDIRVARVHKLLKQDRDRMELYER